MNDEKYPFKGSAKYLKPYTYKQWETYDYLRVITVYRVPFA